ncbi:MAG: glycogen synthase GlgA [Candidatus Wallbacteria bacterium]|nr:glycogen synthase GlgA [Candidatus Wallbacteria bacterium]
MPLKILFAISEAAPFAKTGGLADVGGALPRAVDALNHGHDVRVIMPRYRSVSTEKTDYLIDFPVPLGSERETAVLRWTSMPGGVPVLFVDNYRFFDRDGVYGSGGGSYVDNGLRFGFFCRAVVEYVRRSGWFPDVIHINDWQTGLLPVFLRTLEHAEPKLARVATVCTVHNLAYQGAFDPSLLGRLSLPAGLFDSQFLEFYGAVCFLKAGLIFADKLTTVSPRYSQEIQTEEYGCNLEGVLQKRSLDLVGILNGIDTDVWDPETDTHCWDIHYDSEHLSGKAEIKRRLLRDFRMPYRPQTPLIGVVSRLAGQKGLDIIESAIPALMSRDLQMVFLGTGERRFEDMLRYWSARLPGRLNSYIGFSETVAHRIEAGSDMFLMPSYYEPCGLNQMISLRYGTIPIVRRTGGLADSVIDLSQGSRGTGFVFEHYDANAIVWAVDRALGIYADLARWSKLAARAMKKDFSWRKSAEHYEEVYEWAAAERAGGRRGRFSMGA